MHCHVSVYKKSPRGHVRTCLREWKELFLRCEALFFCSLSVASFGYIRDRKLFRCFCPRGTVFHKKKGTKKRPKKKYRTSKAYNIVRVDVRYRMRQFIHFFGGDIAFTKLLDFIRRSIYSKIRGKKESFFWSFVILFYQFFFSSVLTRA